MLRIFYNLIFGGGWNNKVRILILQWVGVTFFIIFWGMGGCMHEILLKVYYNFWPSCWSFKDPYARRLSINLEFNSHHTIGLVYTLIMTMSCMLGWFVHAILRNFELAWCN